MTYKQTRPCGSFRADQGGVGGLNLQLIRQVRNSRSAFSLSFKFWDKLTRSEGRTRRAFQLDGMTLGFRFRFNLPRICEQCNAIFGLGAKIRGSGLSLSCKFWDKRTRSEGRGLRRVSIQRYDPVLRFRFRFNLASRKFGDGMRHFCGLVVLKKKPPVEGQRHNAGI